MATYTLDKKHSNSVAVASPTCFHCRHHADREIADRTCAAFPSEIPIEIWNGMNDHTSNYPGDNGIHFEPTLKKAA